MEVDSSESVNVSAVSWHNKPDHNAAVVSCVVKKAIIQEMKLRLLKFWNKIKK